MVQVGFFAQNSRRIRATCTTTPLRPVAPSCGSYPIRPVFLHTAPKKIKALLLSIAAPRYMRLNSQVLCSQIVPAKTAWQLTVLEKVDYNTRMVRPRKHGRLRMDTDLRIPLTSEQKALIDQATADEPEGKAAWARAILLDAAKRKITKQARQSFSG